MEPLVSAGWLREHMDDPGVRIVDCRFRLTEPGAGEQLWLAGHIPGAAFLDVDRDLSSPPSAPPAAPRGRHPLPGAQAFEASARRAGIGPDTLVVAYDEAAEGGAARLWWLLRHFGHDNVTVLDGGLRGWREGGGALRTGPERPHPGTFTARPREGDTAEPAERVGATPSAAASPLLLDARAPERFRGETEPVDPVAGHIPGAVNLPFADLAPEGRFLPAAELRDRLEAVGAREGRGIVAYCGSGITACVLVLAAEAAGVGPAQLYPGSWSEWSGRGLPVETGRAGSRSTEGSDPYVVS